MARGALQVIGERPVVLVAVGLLDHLRERRRDAAELHVTEGVARAHVGQELSFRVARALGGDDDAIALAVDGLLDAREELLAIEGDLGEQDDVRRVPGLAGGETARGRDPARMPAHHLEDEHARRRARHGGDVERRLERRHGDVLRDRAESRAAIGDREVVVHGLRDSDAGDGVARLHAELRELQRRVHRIVAAVVEEVADVVRAEHLDQPLVLRAIALEVLELVARGAEGARGRMAQRADRRCALAAGVDEVLGQGADDAVTARVEAADAALVLAAGLDDAGGGRVDDGSDAA